MRVRGGDTTDQFKAFCLDVVPVEVHLVPSRVVHFGQDHLMSEIGHQTDQHW